MSDLSDSSLGAAVCRICHSSENSLPYMSMYGREPLISPCMCKGSMGLQHRSCLEHWLTMKQTSICEICHFKFDVRSVSPSVWSFICSRSLLNGSRSDDRGIGPDVACFVVLTIFVSGSAALCIRQGWNVEGDDGLWNPIEGFSMFIMAAILISLYFLWLGITLSFYVRTYKTWSQKQKVIYVTDQLSSDESDHFNRHLNPVYRFYRRMRRTIMKMFIREKRNESDLLNGNVLEGVEPIDVYTPANVSDTIPLAANAEASPCSNSEQETFSQATTSLVKSPNCDSPSVVSPTTSQDNSATCSSSSS